MSAVWETELSSSDLKNGNLRFATSNLGLEPEFFGGTNKNEKAASRLTVQFSPGSISQQWIYGDKKIFANRNPHTTDFYARIGAKIGTRVRVIRTSHSNLLIERV